MDIEENEKKTPFPGCPCY